jgi:trehalose/maltose hydrolase-like predicted phosphorylase
MEHEMSSETLSRTYQAGNRPREAFEVPERSTQPGLAPYDRTRFEDLLRPGAYLGNGLVGLRLPPVPFRNAAVAVNGYIGRSIPEGHESLAPAPCPIGADLVAGGVRLSDAMHRVEVTRQSLEMSFGELTTELVFHAPVGDVRMEVVTFTPRQLPALACQQVTLSADAEMSVALEAQMDPRGLSGECLERFMLSHSLDSVLWWQSRGALSTLGAGFVTEFHGADDYATRQNDWGNESLLCLRQYRFDLKPGQYVTLCQYGALVPSTLLPEPHIQTFHVLNFAQDIGFNRLRDENRAAWGELWRGRPIIHAPAAADPNLQAYADSAFFYLHSSAHPASHCGLAPFGLSQSEGYYSGHTFTTDAEVYMFPPLLYTNPDAARALMRYRFQQRDQVNNHALLFGYDGLYFPNQTGRFAGNASRPSATNAVGAASFKNPFVAEAFLAYAQVTGDEDFLRDEAWPIIRGIADWIITRVTPTKRGYEVRNLQINEQYANTHNEPPVNRSFKRVLEQASDIARRIGRRPNPRWRRVAERLVILTDEADLRRETAWFTQTYKVFERAGNREEVIREMERLAGVPLNSLQPVNTALKLGERDLAARWWPEEIARHFEPNRFGLWREWTDMWAVKGGEHPQEQACFVAFAGQLLKQLLVLFPRLEPSFESPASWAVTPVTLPEGWEAIEVERVWIRDEPMRMVARHGETTELTQHPEGERVVQASRR